MKVTSHETQEVLSLKIKQLLNDTYQVGPLSLDVEPKDVVVRPIGDTLLKPHSDCRFLIKLKLRGEVRTRKHPYKYPCKIPSDAQAIECNAKTTLQ